MKVTYKPFQLFGEEVDESLKDYIGKSFTLLGLHNGGCLLEDEHGGKHWFTGIEGLTSHNGENSETAQLRYKLKENNNEHI